MKTVRDFLAAGIALAVLIFASMCFGAAWQEASVAMLLLGVLLLLVPVAVAADLWLDWRLPLRKRPAYLWVRFFLGCALSVAAVFDGLHSGFTALEGWLFWIGLGVVLITANPVESASRKWIRRQTWAGWFLPGASLRIGIALLWWGLSLDAASEDVVGLFCSILGAVVVLSGLISGRKPLARWLGGRRRDRSIVSDPGS